MNDLNENTLNLNCFEKTKEAWGIFSFFSYTNVETKNVCPIAYNSPLPDMKQQTAVEWLWNLSQTKELEASDFEQALAMEKEQIMDAHIEGQRVFDTHQHTQWTTDQAELYYNQTYGK